MKKLLVFVFILFLQSNISKAQLVNIPDTNFANVLTSLYPNCMAGSQLNTTCSEVLNCTSLHLDYSLIADLTGVEHFVNLTTLTCNYNYLTSLPALPLTLENLECGANAITSLSQLPINLKILDCQQNQLSNLPILPNSLQTLICNQNQISYIPNLPDSLQYLNCYQNQLNNLPALPSSLKILDCGGNLITSMQFPNSLEELYWFGAQITALPALPQSLLVLECSSGSSAGPYFDSLPQLPPSLEYLTCSSRGLTSLPQLPSTLQSLSCSNNSLTNLPSLPNSLKYLHCGGNDLTSLPSIPNALLELSCHHNQLVTLPSLPFTLQKLYCYNNLLTSLPTLGNTMHTLVIDDNNITCLNNLPMITGGYGDISNNPLTCVPNQTSYSLGLPLCLDNDTINNPNQCLSTVNIAGYVFTDNFINNCTYNASDLASVNIPVKLFDSLNTLVAQSYTSGGTFGFMVNQTGPYKVKIDSNNLPIAMACSQADSQIVNLVSLSNGIYNVNFPVQCIQAFDVDVHTVNTQGIVFPGQTHTLSTNISNNENWFNLNCTQATYSGTVSIDVTGPVNYIAPANNALIPQISGNTFTYSVSNFNSLTPNSFNLLFQTDTTAQAGNQICVTVNVSTNPTDLDALNNQYNYCYQVVNSYDPNMKEVYPVNVLPGYDDWFTYTIHFQNTGNAPAFNIRLRDTLDANLDINTFEVRGYSHPAAVSLNGNILTVLFNNIMLPDSTGNYEGSMGYFQYRLKPLPNLPNATQIENTAYIYFDYNAPIITNTTQNNFDFTVGQLEAAASKNEFVLYPNPSNGLFNFKDTKNLKQVEVYNLLGEQILAQGNQKQINLSGFAKGVYYAKINGEVVLKLMKE